MKKLKGQLSAEMLILIVVVIAVVALVASQLTKTTEKAGKSIETQGNFIIEQAEQQVKSKSGEFCKNSTHCISGSCDEPNYKCN